MPDAAERLAELDAHVGPLRVSLYAWCQIVGTADFVGKAPASWDNPGYQGFQGAAYKRFVQEHPRPTSAEFRQFEKEHPEFTGAIADEAIYLDPLVIQPMEHTLQLAEPTDEGSDRHRVPLAPDYNHKYFVSGGGPCEITTPCPAIDAPFEGEWHDTTFVNYLRICFRWGGFPGIECVPNPPTADVAYLTKDLLPI